MNPHGVRVRAVHTEQVDHEWFRVFVHGVLQRPDFDSRQAARAFGLEVMAGKRPSEPSNRKAA